MSTARRNPARDRRCFLVVGLTSLDTAEERCLRMIVHQQTKSNPTLV
ncbi:hypothetical protein [Rhizobium mayense]|uniref:Uncharacterized protein n=1 Tax=Rhizobium mayense TaxID=1312184 RepID=A0ABT7JR96_9HYPH|nr:hypothetical protein [Rhizobium mayense]MDL2398866.1 hypothetical protein [Rhizobium mayense]